MQVLGLFRPRASRGFACTRRERELETGAGGRGSRGRDAGVKSETLARLINLSRSLESGAEVAAS